MKTSKRVLGVLLTLIMLVNVFAVSVFAAYPSDSSIALIVKTDKDNYSAGDEVTLTISAKATSQVGALRIGGQFELGYNSAALEPYSTTDLSLEGQKFVAGTSYSDSYNKSYSQAILNENAGSMPSAGKGWDNVIIYSIADDGATGVDCVDAETTLFTVKMKIPANVQDGTYTIGFNQYGYEENYTAYATTADGLDIYGNDGSAYSYSTAAIYDFGVATYTIGEGGVTPPPPGDPITVENITTQVQWQDKDAGKMRVAFRGNIKNYTLNLVDGSDKEIADISEMGVVYSKSNTDPTVGGANCSNAPAWTIYDFTNGSYFFRAVVGNYQYDNTEKLYANAYIIIDGQTIYASNDPIETTGAQAYAAGVANGMSAK